MSYSLDNILSVLKMHFGHPSPSSSIVPDPDGIHANVLIRDGYTLKRIDGATEARPSHTFKDVRCFADYLNREYDRNRLDAGDCDIVMSEGRFTAYFDPYDKAGTNVACQLEPDTDFWAWQNASETTMSVDAFHKFIRRVLPTFLPFDGGKVSLGEYLLTQLGSLKVSQDSEVEIRTNRVGLVEFSGGTGKTTVSGKMPDTFKVCTPVYEGVLDADGNPMVYTFDVLLTVKVEGGKPAFSFCIPRYHQVVREAQLDAVAYLRDLLHDDFLVGVGVPCSKLVQVGPVL